MIKGVIAVTVFSVCNVILFAVFCYLMSTVNPPPLANPGIFRSSGDAYSLDESTDYHNPEYGLYKVPEKDIRELKQYLRTLVTEDFHLENPFLRSLMSTEKFNMSDVIENIDRSNTSESKSQKIKRTGTKYNETSEVSTENNSKNISDIDNGNTRSVILKILTKKGESNVEIQLPDNSDEGSQLTDDHSENESKSNLSINISPNEKKKPKIRLRKNILIKILPNNLILVNNIADPITVDNTTVQTQLSLGNLSDITVQIRAISTDFPDISPKKITVYEENQNISDGNNTDYIKPDQSLAEYNSILNEGESKSKIL